MEFGKLWLREIPAKESTSLESMHDGEVLVGLTSKAIGPEIVVSFFWDFLFLSFLLVDDDGLIDELIDADLEEIAKF